MGRSLLSPSQVLRWWLAGALWPCCQGGGRTAGDAADWMPLQCWSMSLIGDFRCRCSNVQYVFLWDDSRKNIITIYIQVHIVSWSKVSTLRDMFRKRYPGQRYLGLTDEDIRGFYATGKVCGDDRGVIDGRATGVVRLSFGLYSTFSDVDRWMEVLMHFVDQLPQEQPSMVASDTSVPEKVTELASGTGTISALKVYPVKGCGALEVKRWPMDGASLFLDRRWCLTLASRKRPVSAKQAPRLTNVRLSLKQEERRFVLVLSSKFHPQKLEMVLNAEDSQILLASGVQTFEDQIDGESSNTVTCWIWWWYLVTIFWFGHACTNQGHAKITICQCMQLRFWATNAYLFSVFCCTPRGWLFSSSVALNQVRLDEEIDSAAAATAWFEQLLNIQGPLICGFFSMISPSDNPPIGGIYWGCSPQNQHAVARFQQEQIFLIFLYNYNMAFHMIYFFLVGIHDSCSLHPFSFKWNPIVCWWIIRAYALSRGCQPPTTNIYIYILYCIYIIYNIYI